jgi:hypothetical protein
VFTLAPGTVEMPPELTGPESRVGTRPVKYLNNILEQDHRAIKRRVKVSQGFRSFQGACRLFRRLSGRGPPNTLEAASGVRRMLTHHPQWALVVGGAWMLLVRRSPQFADVIARHEIHINEDRRPFRSRQTRHFGSSSESMTLRACPEAEGPPDAAAVADSVVQDSAA